MVKIACMSVKCLDYLGSIINQIFSTTRIIVNVVVAAASMLLFVNHGGAITAYHLTQIYKQFDSRHRNYRLRINKSQLRNRIRFVNGEFVVDMTSPDADEDTKSKVRQLYDGWLKRTAYPILKNKTEIYAQ
jgi:hypothetical protein